MITFTVINILLNVAWYSFKPFPIIYTESTSITANIIVAIFSFPYTVAIPNVATFESTVDAAQD